uniref:olfactory receptor 6N2-like n=1 Tax=Monopterus albus TaxID=43700 RepID=UPI0009B4A6CE|nr:olfactory receptor 6N2-like [Monopterus albus]
MDNNLNATYITLDGYVEVDKYRYLYFMIMFTAYILILCSNSTIVSLIVIHKNLHEPMYVFIAALLLNSVLLSTCLYPKMLTDVLSEKQIISYSACLFQWYAYYCVAFSENLLLAVMAYDRYVSICKPLQYPTIMRKSKICIFLVLAWLLPACVFTVPVSLSADAKLCKFTFKGIICGSAVIKLHCERSRAVYLYGFFVIGSLDILPVVFILFTYTRILLISYRSSREVRRKGVQTCLPNLLILINFTCSMGFEVILARLNIDFPQTVRLIMTLQVILYSPLFNPIVYGLKMKEIYKHIKRLLCADKMV